MQIDAKTKLCAVIGNPVLHSLSPVIHNAAIAHHKLNAIFLAFAICDIKQALEAMRSLGIRAFSVTIPYKEAIVPYLDSIEGEAQSLGNVNTVVNQNGILKGYNTDIDGVRLSLRGVVIKNKSVLLIGAGGVAKTIAYVIHRRGGRVHIINRDIVQARRLAQRYRGDVSPLENIEDVIATVAPHIIINATPVGMGNLEGKSLVPGRLLRKDFVVYDVIYNPLKTKLIRDAERTGCKTITGLQLFLGQGARQFELWSGRRAPREVMEKALYIYLRNV